MQSIFSTLTSAVCLFAATATNAGTNPFFVFDNGLHGESLQTIDAQLDLVKETGFAGLSWRTDEPGRVKQVLDGAKQRELKCFAIYVNLDLKDGKLVYDKGLQEIIALCKGTDTMIWPYLTSKQFKNSDPAGDDIAVTGLRELADLCAANGLRIAIYPHVNMWVHRVEDAVRVAKKVNRKNVGVTFNLCHALLDGAEARIPALIEEAAPYLFVATINGADSGASKMGEIDRIIQTLDKGTYDVGAVLRKLKAAGFTGPIGLQCYNIKGDPKALLPGSMAAWRKISGALGASRSPGQEVKEEAAKEPAAASAAAVPGAIATDNKPAPAPIHYGANLVENCDFESGDIVPEAWYIDAGADALKCELAGGKAGPRCVRVAETKKFLLQQEIPVFSGSTYKVSAHVKTKDFSCKRGYLVIVPYGWPTQFGVILNDLKGTSDWQLVEETVKVDRKPEEKKYTFAFYIEEGKGDLWLDGVRVEEVLQGVTVRPGAIVCDFTTGVPRGLATVTVSNGGPEPRRIDIAGMQPVPQTVDLPPGAAAEVRVGIPLKPVWQNRTDLYVRDDAAEAGKLTAKTSGGEVVDVQHVTRAWSNLCIEPLQVVVQDPWQAKMPSGSTEYVKAKVKLALPPEQLRAGTLQSRLVSRETGKEALRHEVRGPAAAIPLELDVRELPWGAYDLHVNLSDAGGRAMVSTRRLATVLPGGKQQIRVLNNLVSELMDARSRGLLGQTRIEFMNPRDGWVWFSAAGDCALKTSNDSLLSSEANKPAAEAMRLLRAGKHVLEVSGQPSELTVRAIPALVYNIYWPNAPGGQRIEPFGRHTWERLSKHMLPNVNTIESVVVDTPEHREWLAQGKHWTPHVQAPGLIDKQAWTVDKMREVWLNPGKPTGWPERPSFTLDKFTGISVDEYAWSGPSAEIVKMTTASIADLADHPAYAGKLWIPWFASTRGANAEDRPFLKTVLGNGWPFKEEVYLSEMPTEPENLVALRNGFAKVASKYEAASPGSVRRMIFVLSYSGLGTMSANRCPQADFRVHLDMQAQALATSPEYFGLWGVEPYRSHNVDEEILNCMGMLLRHYCIEGKTGRMLSDPYELKHVANPDFTDGTQGWQVQAAEPGSVRTDAFAGYGTIQGRYPRRNGIGDTFAVLTRSAKAPNTVSQQLRGLTPGRLYSLKAFTGDYADLQAGKTRKNQHGLWITLDRAEVQPGGFSHPFVSHDFPAALAAYAKVAGKPPFWMTYHWLRFRATSPTATLSLSDWAKPGEPGGPAGQQTMVNFVEVQPVLEPRS